jgi:hypothetical protein
MLVASAGTCFTGGRGLYLDSWIVRAALLPAAWEREDSSRLSTHCRSPSLLVRRFLHAGAEPARCRVARQPRDSSEPTGEPEPPRPNAAVAPDDGS